MVHVDEDEFAASERELVRWRCLPQAFGGVSNSPLTNAGNLRGPNVAQDGRTRASFVQKAVEI